jgi:predicted 3-demethylubiquinone-9 3-methyltransferase (glyoxalase superfamily)
MSFRDAACQHGNGQNKTSGGTMTSKPFTTCLWFDTQGEEAANFYTSIFKNSKITSVSRYTDAGPRPKGTVQTVEFELNGQKFLALNGGPEHKPNPSFSIVVECADQAEVDYYWERLTDGGQEIVCGWLADRYGFCWQIVPTVFLEMLRDPDPAKVARVTAAMFTMKKFDIAALTEAYDAG